MQDVINWFSELPWLWQAVVAIFAFVIALRVIAFVIPGRKVKTVRRVKGENPNNILVGVVVLIIIGAVFAWQSGEWNPLW